MIEITEDIYKGLASCILDDINNNASNGIYRGSVDYDLPFGFGNNNYSFISTFESILVLYYNHESGAIEDVKPVEYSFYTWVDEEKQENDFSFDRLKKYL